MFSDLNNTGMIKNTYGGYDVTIVSAGAAGITLALKLSKYGKKVALVEGEWVGIQRGITTTL